MVNDRQLEQQAHSFPAAPGGLRRWPIPPRATAEELLDQGAGTAQDVRENLLEMWRINRALGGMRALTAHLYPRLEQLSGPVVLADLGTGSAHVGGAIARWARARHVDVRVMAIDWAARHLAVAREWSLDVPEIALLQADAARLPLPARSVDFVFSSLFLHHFSPEQVIGLLREAYAATRRTLIMSDLVRGWLPLAAFRLVQPVFARNYLTRHDGALSVRRAYTPVELLELARRAGLDHAEIHTHWPWRMTLVVDR